MLSKERLSKEMSSLAASDPPHSVAQLAGFYWRQSRRPLASLLFVLPILAVYEIGVLALDSGAQPARNGVDQWLRGALAHFGFGQYFLLPVLIVCILLAWHYTTRQPWRLRVWVVWVMLAESAALAVLLVFIWRGQAQLFHWFAATSSETESAATASISATVSRIVSFFGAGIYEELFFRLMLLPITAGLIRLAGYGERATWLTAVVLTSLLFSAAHYLGPLADSWQLLSFVFRFVAGAFFCLLFIYRGFGITVGAHALYDVLVGGPDSPLK